MEKRELEILKTFLESADLSQLNLPEVKRMLNDLNLEGVDLSKLDLPKLNLSEVKTVPTDINLEGVDLSKLSLPTLEEIKEQINSFDDTSENVRKR
ncbi:MAG: hypothetical protein IJB83_01525 [Bacilli bacterium]|nr:hypothetical protein [Bacilli bacterium]